MGQSHKYPAWGGTDGATVCKARGHHNPRRYGDGVFCSDCEEPCSLPENRVFGAWTVRIQCDNEILFRCRVCGPTMNKQFNIGELISCENMSTEIERRYAEFQKLHEHPEPKIYKPAPKPEWLTHLTGH